VAREMREDLAQQLAGLLNEVDEAIRARFRDLRRRETVRRGRGRRGGLRSAVVAALVRFVGSARRLSEPGSRGPRSR